MLATFNEEDKTILLTNNGELKATFNISKKRIFISILDRICEDLNYLFKSTEGEFIFNRFVDIKNKMEKYEFSKYKDLIQYVTETLISNLEVSNIIYDKVKNTYNINIETDKNKNEELEFRNVHAKMIIAIGYYSRILIPILADYINLENNRRKHKRGDMAFYDNMFLDMYYRVFEVYRIDEYGNEVDLATKIFRFVASAVDNTSYSDKVIWDYLKNKAINEKNLTIRLFRQVVKDIIPKLEDNKSVVSFLHVVIKKQIEFQFTQNFKITYKPITSIKTDKGENSVNPFTKMEQKLVKADEAMFIYSKESIHQYLTKPINSFKIKKDELEYLMNNLQINTFQPKIVNFFISKKLNGGNAYQCSRHEFMQLLIHTRNWLLDSNFKLLAAVMTANIVYNNPKKTIGRGKIVNDMYDSKIYNSIVSKYSAIENRIKNYNVLNDFMAEIINTDFAVLDMYSSNKEYFEKENFKENVISECLEFLEKL